MEQYDPGNRAADITPVFAELKAFLKEFVPEALDVQEERLAKSPLKPLSGNYPIDRQRELGLAMMAAVGFDLTHGSLSVSHHPFCGGVPTDVRITTRYRTDDFLSALMGVLHETGHALYEQNLPGEWAHWPLGKARGMAMHESQSLFVEKQLGRNPAFWDWALPVVEKHLGEDWSMADILPHVHFVERGLIRVDADEVTYPLHVILRFELEQELVSGRLEAADIPDAWDAKMRDYLGLSTIGNFADGPMQDVHWPGGAFGYFPSYTLGAMMAAQQWAALKREHPSADDDLAKGKFDAVNEWRREKIWSQGSRFSTPELLERATGEKLTARISPSISRGATAGREMPAGGRKAASPAFTLYSRSREALAVKTLSPSLTGARRQYFRRSADHFIRGRFRHAIFATRHAAARADGARRLRRHCYHAFHRPRPGQGRQLQDARRRDTRQPGQPCELRHERAGPCDLQRSGGRQSTL